MMLLACFRGRRGSHTLWLECLGGCAPRRVRLEVVLLLEHSTLTLLRLLLELLLAHLSLLQGLLLMHLLLAGLFLPLLELLLELLLLTLLAVAAHFLLQGTPLSLMLTAEYLGRQCLQLGWCDVALALLKRSPFSILAFSLTTVRILWLLRER